MSEVEKNALPLEKSAMQGDKSCFSEAESKGNYTLQNASDKVKRGIEKSFEGEGAYFIRAGELVEKYLPNKMPKEFIPSSSLVYSSPGTLSYNSPGALGFGVKRAALVIPESVMLLVAPDCCGRNSTILSENEGYANRMFYLSMSESDIVTGGHLSLIPKAVKEVCETARPRPKVVIICVTCVDALLGTDMERVCKKAMEAVEEVKVLPSYMYALTREGTRPPMTSVRDTVYSLLERLEVRRDAINILGFFSPLSKKSELISILNLIGIKTARQIAECKTIEEYMKMGECNFNLVLNSECLYAAERLKERLNMPYIELYRLYDIERIEKQYRLFARAIGSKIEDSALEQYKDEAKSAIERFRTLAKEERLNGGGEVVSFAIGQMLNASPFELASALSSMHFSVPYIIATPSNSDWPFIKMLALISPKTKIFSPTHPSIARFTPVERVDIAIGKDIEGLFSSAASVKWFSEEEPFGFMAVKCFFDECFDKIKAKKAHSMIKNKSSASAIKGSGIVPSKIKSTFTKEGEGCKRLYRYLSPFASDQAGASSVFYDMGGVTVIVDAGGCSGNIAGFDERRFFFDTASPVFSACLRDMDAILGRDKELVEKTKEAIRFFPDAAFIAYVSTPVPAVIGTDFRALCKMTSAKCGIPSIAVDTTGLSSYSTGEVKAYKAIIDECVKEKDGNIDKGGEGIIAVFGATPLDMAAGDSIVLLKKRLEKEYIGKKVVVIGEKGSFEELHGKVYESVAVSPAGIEGAKHLKEKAGVPYKIASPLSSINYPINDKDIEKFYSTLIIHQQCIANSVRKMVRGCSKKIDTATFGIFNKSIAEEGDCYIEGERELINLVESVKYDCIIADPLFFRALLSYKGKRIDLPHWAVSASLFSIENERDFLLPLAHLMKTGI